MPASPKIAFRARPHLLARLRARGSPGLAAARDLQRYYDALDAELAALRLTDEDAAALRSLLGPIDPSTVPVAGAAALLQGLVAQAASDGLARRLRPLTTCRALAVLDYLERTAPGAPPAGAPPP